MLSHVLLAIISLQEALASVYDLPLNRFSFVRSHDAATGYLEDDGVESTVINKWTRTQTENITTQLNCGVRVFDWRPILVNGTVMMHHGQVTIPVNQIDMIKELVDWAASSDKISGEEYEKLILVNLWDCTNVGCDEKATSEFQDFGIRVIPTSQARNLTVYDVMQLANLTTGGYVLVLNGEFAVPGWLTYNQYLECHGFLDLEKEMVWRDEVTTCINRTFNIKGIDSRGIDFHRVLECILSADGVLMTDEHYNCWKDSKTHTFAYDQLLNFVMNLTSMDPPSSGELWVAQGAWAEDIADIALGFLLGSNLITDEVNSGLNQALATEVRNVTRILNSPPMIGINNVCNGGEELRQALLWRVRKLAMELYN